MPRMDGTGPLGTGPMGRGRGRCRAGGFSFGQERYGRNRGKGLGFGPGRFAGANEAQAPLSRGEELSSLEKQLDDIQSRINAIKESDIRKE